MLTELGGGSKKTKASFTSFGVLAMCRQCSSLLKKRALLPLSLNRREMKPRLGW